MITAVGVLIHGATAGNEADLAAVAVNGFEDQRATEVPVVLKAVPGADDVGGGRRSVAKGHHSAGAAFIVVAGVAVFVAYRGDQQATNAAIPSLVFYRRCGGFAWDSQAQECPERATKGANKNHMQYRRGVSRSLY